MADNIPSNKRTTSPWVVDPKIQEMVDQMKSQDPGKYKRAQEFGDFLMGTRYANIDDFIVSQDDLEGDELIFHEIVKNMRYHGMDTILLLPHEEEVLQKKLGAQWKEKISSLI